MTSENLHQQIVDAQPATEQPLEQFRITYTDRDMKQAFRLVYNKKRNTLLVVVLFALAFLYLITIESSELGIGLGLGILIAYLIVYIQQIISIKKAEKISVAKVNKTYEYTVFSNKFIICAYENDEFRDSKIIKNGEIDKVWENEEYLVYSCSNQLFILRKENLPSTGVLNLFFSTVRAKSAYNK